MVGAGLAGVVAALVLARAGHSVQVVDRLPARGPDFRCEKISGAQLRLVRQLDVQSCLREAATFDETLIARSGRIVDRRVVSERGMRYDRIVQAFRAAWPETIGFRQARVTDIETGPDLQHIRFDAGDPVAARLVVLATGGSEALRTRLGLGKRPAGGPPSVVFGFDLAWPKAPATDLTSLTYYSETPGDGISYVTMFPVDGILRVNLFTYRAPDSEWAQRMRRDPLAAMLAAMPGLRALLGPVDCLGVCAMRVIEPCWTTDHARDGLVAIGDAFGVSCPGTGFGVTRLLTDVTTLGDHVSNWLATPGMARDKIAAFYADPAKHACDAASDRAHAQAKGHALGAGPLWTARRGMVAVRTRLHGWTGQVGLAGAIDRWRLKA